MSEPTIHARAGWTLLRVAAVFCIGIAAGAAFGVVGALVITVVDDSWDYVGVTTFIAMTVGSVVAAIAGLGSLAALLITDHWGERSPRHRVISTAIGAAIAVGAGTTLFAAVNAATVSTQTLVVGSGVLAVCAGAAAALGVGLSERWQRRRNDAGLH